MYKVPSPKRRSYIVEFLISKLTTVSFVCAVLTVVLLITRPTHRDATPTWTSEEGSRTLRSPAPCGKLKEISTNYASMNSEIEVFEDEFIYVIPI